MLAFLIDAYLDAEGRGPRQRARDALYRYKRSRGPQELADEIRSLPTLETVRHAKTFPGTAYYAAAIIREHELEQEAYSNAHALQDS